MAIVAGRAVINYESFETSIDACIDTLLRSKAALYILAKDRNIGFSVKFNFKPDEIITMTIESDQAVHSGKPYED